MLMVLPSPDRFWERSEEKEIICQTNELQLKMVLEEENMMIIRFMGEEVIIVTHTKMPRESLDLL